MLLLFCYFVFITVNVLQMYVNCYALVDGMEVPGDLVLFTLLLVSFLQMCNFPILTRLLFVPVG